MFFYDFFYSKINPVYYFYLEINISFAQICGGFLIIFSNFFIIYYFKAKINLALLFRLNNSENQYTRHKKYGVHLGCKVGLLTSCVCRKYSSSVRKTHSPSARASLLPTTRTANSKLGLKRPTLRPRYTIYYYKT